MRKIILLSLILSAATTSIAQQNIGIGTTSPNSKALLDISSNSKGVLLPRMTSLERLGITSPPNGLLVYDTDKDEFYHHNGIGWRAILNSEYWTRPSTNRSRISNLTDSVGIGTNSPTEWLDVDGNIRSRNNLRADGQLSAASVVSSGTLVTVGTSLLSGEVTTNSDLIMNNAAATIQLKTGGVNKGFLQLSGDNLRMGTNSGNTTGKLIIRNNGADRIAIEADGKLTTPATGDNNNMIPLCYGVVNDAGVLLRGTDNVTIEKVGTPGGSSGVYYRISCPGISATSVISVTPDIEYMDQIAARCYLAGTARVYTYTRFFNATSGNTETYYFHSGFSFIIYR